MERLETGEHVRVIAACRYEGRMGRVVRPMSTAGYVGIVLDGDDPAVYNDRFLRLFEPRELRRANGSCVRAVEPKGFGKANSGRLCRGKHGICRCRKGVQGVRAFNANGREGREHDIYDARESADVARRRE